MCITGAWVTASEKADYYVIQPLHSCDNSRDPVNWIFQVLCSLSAWEIVSLGSDMWNVKHTGDWRVLVVTGKYIKAMGTLNLQVMGPHFETASGWKWVDNK